MKELIKEIKEKSPSEIELPNDKETVENLVEILRMGYEIEKVLPDKVILVKK